MTHPEPKTILHGGKDLGEYWTVVSVTPRSRRSIYGRRYLVKCECGWSVDARDYIAAKQAWRGHLSVSDNQ